MSGISFSVFPFKTPKCPPSTCYPPANIQGLSRATVTLAEKPMLFTASGNEVNKYINKCSVPHHKMGPRMKKCSQESIRMPLCVSLPSPLFPSRQISSLSNTHMCSQVAARGSCLFFTFPLLFATSYSHPLPFPLLHRVWRVWVKKKKKEGKKNPQKVISFSHYRWPFHWPSVIAIMRCGSWERLWWGVRANTWASTNILSTLYLDTAVRGMLPPTCRAGQPSRTHFFEDTEMPCMIWWCSTLHPELGSTVCALNRQGGEERNNKDFV